MNDLITVINRYIEAHKRMIEAMGELSEFAIPDSCRSALATLRNLEMLHGFVITELQRHTEINEIHKKVEANRIPLGVSLPVPESFSDILANGDSDEN